MYLYSFTVRLVYVNQWTTIAIIINFYQLLVLLIHGDSLRPEKLLANRRRISSRTTFAEALTPFG